MDTTLAGLEDGMRKSAGWSMAVAVLAIIGGIFILFSPAYGAIAATAVFAVVAIIAGVMELGHAWRTRQLGGAFWRFLLGIAYVAAGVYVIMKPGIGLMALAFAFGVMLLVRGFSALMLGFTLRGTRVSGWHIVDGLLSLLLGAFVLAKWPVGSILYLGLWVGISLIFNGINRFSIAATLRRVLPPAPRTPMKPAHV
jgi:uncharacterized membrane protein HdeD (DUF308 family)